MWALTLTKRFFSFQIEVLRKKEKSHFDIGDIKYTVADVTQYENSGRGIFFQSLFLMDFLLK